MKKTLMVLLLLAFHLPAQASKGEYSFDNGAIRQIVPLDTVFFVPNQIVHIRFPEKVVGVYASIEVDNVLAPNLLDLLISPSDTTEFTIHVIMQSQSMALVFQVAPEDTLYVPFIEYVTQDSMRRILGLPPVKEGSVAGIEPQGGYTPSESEIKHLIKAIYEGDTAVTGYSVLDGDIIHGDVDVTTGTIVDTHLVFKTEALEALHVEAKVVRRYLSPLLMGVELTLTNKSSQDVILRETDLYMIGVRAVALSTRYLRKGQTIRAIVVADRNILLKVPKRRFVLFRR